MSDKARERWRAYRLRKLASDPDYFNNLRREAYRRQRERMKVDPDYRREVLKKARDYKNKRYATDLDFRLKQREWQIAHRQKAKYGKIE